MTEWHKEWQSNFNNKEISIGNRIADVIENNIVLEFQHSPISKDLIEIRSTHYQKNNYEIYWIIDCNEIIDIETYENIKILNNDNNANIDETIETNRYMLRFKKDIWKYENFINQENIFLNIQDKIFKINPKEVKCQMIDVNEYKTKKEFIESIKNKINIWNDDDLSQCILYHNQRGAGCGKTYESIQLLNNDIRFKYKEYFIYLTKMNSAKEVIYTELKKQNEENKLDKLQFYKNDKGELGNMDRQYKINYFNKETNNHKK